MTRRYEIVYILDSAMDETQVNSALDRHQALLKPNGSSEFIIETNHWGRRTLAYPIGRHEVGYYVVVNLKTTGDRLAEFERSVKLDESIIRYLVILNEGEIPVPIPPPSETASRGRDDDDESRPPRGKAPQPREEAKEAGKEPATEAAPVAADKEASE